MRNPSRGSNNSRHQHKFFWSHPVQRSSNWGHCRLQCMAELKIVLLSFEWASKAAAVSLRAASTSYCPFGQPLEWSYLFYRVSYGSLHAWTLSRLVSTEWLLHVVHAKLNSQHSCKTSACIQLPHSTGVPGHHLAPVAVWPASHSSRLSPPTYCLACRPFFEALLFGVEGGKSTPWILPAVG